MKIKSIKIRIFLHRLDRKVKQYNIKLNNIFNIKKLYYILVKRNIKLILFFKGIKIYNIKQKEEIIKSFSKQIEVYK